MRTDERVVAVCNRQQITEKPRKMSVLRKYLVMYLPSLIQREISTLRMATGSLVTVKVMARLCNVAVLLHSGGGASVHNGCLHQAAHVVASENSEGLPD